MSSFGIGRPDVQPAFPTTTPSRDQPLRLLFREAMLQEEGTGVLP